MKNERMIKAINYATMAHNGQIRKTTGIPKIVHPYAVAMRLQKVGYEEDIVIAGLLHDVVEDCEGYTLQDIKKEFGDRVAKFVEDVSEEDKSLPWKDRKVKHIEHIKNASFEVKLICAADKLHNLTSLYQDTKVYGDEIWNKFNAPRDEIKWYYKAMCDSIINGFENEDIEIFNELREVVQLTVGGASE